MRKEDKALIIERLGEQLKEYAHFYLVDVTGLNAGKTSDLRRQCFKSGIKMVVVKNTLLEKAFEAAENDFSAFGDVLKGTTAVLFCDVANAPAKLIKEAGKESGIPALKAAYAEEGVYVGAEHLETLCAIKAPRRMLSLHSPAQVKPFTAYSKRSANVPSNPCLSLSVTDNLPSPPGQPLQAFNKQINNYYNGRHQSNCRRTGKSYCKRSKRTRNHPQGRIRHRTRSCSCGSSRSRSRRCSRC